VNIEFTNQTLPHTWEMESTAFDVAPAEAGSRSRKRVCPTKEDVDPSVLQDYILELKFWCHQFI